MNVNYDILIERLQASGYTFPFMFGVTPTMLSATTSNINMSPNTRYSGATVDQWYHSGGFVTGFTNDKLNMVRSYNEADLYIPYLVLDEGTYLNYFNDTVYSGVTMVVTEGEPNIYVVDAEASGDPLIPLEAEYNLTVIGTDGQTTGLLYNSYTGETYTITDFDGDEVAKPRTDVRYVGEGWNITNVDLSAMTKTEYLLGIAYPPEVQSDIFIDRGATTVMEDHLRMGEIKGLDALLDYGNGYYKVGL